jgi:hypothetical protein
MITELFMQTSNYPSDGVGLSASNPFVIESGKPASLYNTIQLGNAVLVAVIAFVDTLSCPDCNQVGLKFDSWTKATLRIQCTKTCSKPRIGTPTKSGGTMGVTKMLPHLIQFMASKDDRLLYRSLHRKDFQHKERKSEHFDFYVLFPSDSVSFAPPIIQPETFGRSEKPTRTSSPGIKMFVANVRGMTQTIKERLEMMLITKQTDLIFLIETWDTSDVATSLGTVARKPAVRKETTNRPQGGLEIMCHPRLYTQVSEVPTKADGLLKIKLGTNVVSLLYAPPESMKQGEFEDLIRQAAGSTLILGDFNCPLKPDRTRWAQFHRAKFMQQFIKEHDLQIVSNQSSHLDHILATSHQTFANYRWIPPSDAMHIISSDHGILQVDWIPFKQVLSLTNGLAASLLSDLKNLSLS